MLCVGCRFVRPALLVPSQWILRRLYASYGSLEFVEFVRRKVHGDPVGPVGVRTPPSSLPARLEEKMGRMVDRHAVLVEQVKRETNVGSTRYVQLSRELRELTEITQTVQRLWAKRAEWKEDAILAADKAGDGEFRQLARDELIECERILRDLEEELLLQLFPPPHEDSRNAILEVRAGAGGDEASLFAVSLFHMYERYAQLREWSFVVLSLNESEAGGFKDATAAITGSGVFGRLKYESGVHRVQRVPITESMGRVHTSTATVAILPEAKEADIEIDEQRDVRIDVMRASGAGGQHVNKTESAVRVTHLPSGIVVSIQETRSQLQNRQRAMNVLRARLYEAKLKQIQAERRSVRLAQIGTGDRNERIRTYNFPQNRVTDHRINMTIHGVEQVLAGELDDFIDSLVIEDQKALVQSLASDP